MKILLLQAAPRHNYLAKGYVEFAIKLVNRLLEQRNEAPDEHES